MSDDEKLLYLIEIEEAFNNCYDYNSSLRRFYNRNINKSDNILRDTIIAHYKSRGCRYLNRILIDCRNDNNEYILNYTYLLSKILDELPKYQNQVVYRWDNIHEDGTKFLIEKKPKLIQIPQFWSTSKISHPERHQFIINTSLNTKAYDISHISENKFEDEVLLKPNAIFSIEALEDKIIYLHEIEYSKNANQDNMLILKNNFWI